MESVMFLKLLNRRHFIAWGAGLLGGGFAQAKARAQTPKPATVLVLGDSLSAEYGLKRGTGWVALLEKRLAAEKITAKVVNASISGETTSGGRSRVAALVKTHQPTHVIVELGGNDALRGLPLAMTEANLTDIVKTSQAAKAKVLLLGMQVPPNYGADYAAKFAGVFDKVAKAHKAPLVPFFLKGVADGDDALKMFQPDRIHPKEEAHPIMLENVWAEFSKLLK
jgi:acyl-CoA thioesterase I